MTLKDVGNFTGLAEGDLIRLGESVLRDIPDAVIYADREGVIRFWNAGAVRIFGFSQDEARRLAATRPGAAFSTKRVHCLPEKGGEAVHHVFPAMLYHNEVDSREIREPLIRAELHMILAGSTANERCDSHAGAHCFADVFVGRADIRKRVGFRISLETANGVLPIGAALGKDDKRQNLYFVKGSNAVREPAKRFTAKNFICGRRDRWIAVGRHIEDRNVKIAREQKPFNRRGQGGDDVKPQLRIAVSAACERSVDVPNVEIVRHA